MRKTTSVRIAAVAISVLVLLLIALSWYTFGGSKSQSAIPPAAWNTPTPISAPQPNSNGAMARANVHGTGVFVTKGIRQDPGLKWKFKTIRTGANNIAAVQGNVVYFGHDGSVYAVYADTASEKWSREIDNIATSAPAVAGNTVYVGGWEELYALSAERGTVRWSYRLLNGTDETYYSDPVVYGGTVYFGGRKYFYALDSETGREKWKFPLTGGTARSVPAVYEGTVYFGTYSADGRRTTYVYALDSETGQEKWKVAATGGGIGGAVAVTDGVVRAGTWDDGILALDAKSGHEIWRYNPGSGVISSPAAAHGTVYITDHGTLYAVDNKTGKEKWKVAGSDLSSDPVIADGIVYFLTTAVGLDIFFGGQPSGNLHAVDAHSGQELWTFKVEGFTSYAPAVSDGALYFGNDRDAFYAVK